MGTVAQEAESFLLFGPQHPRDWVWWRQTPEDQEFKVILGSRMSLKQTTNINTVNVKS